jgi:hypothetical protein
MRGRRLASRPIAARERLRAFWICAALLALAAGLLSAMPDGARAPEVEREYRPAPASKVAPSGEGAVRAARRFLGDYLALAYGEAGQAPRFRAASASLAARLLGSRRRVPPGARAREPRLLSLGAQPLSPALAAISARIGDGPLRYSLELRAEHLAGRWLITEVGAE